MSREIDLIENVKKEVKRVLGEGKPRRTVEEALQSALDNTTPEHAGAPTFTVDEGDDGSGEWI